MRGRKFPSPAWVYLLAIERAVAPCNWWHGRAGAFVVINVDGMRPGPAYRYVGI